MTYEEFWVTVLQEHSTQQDDMRLGQRYFNRLAQCRPQVAQLLQGSNNDPFYQNRVPFQTHAWTKKLWDR